MTMGHWKSTCSRIFEHYKLVLKREKGHKARWAGKEEVSLGMDFCPWEAKESDTGDFDDGLHSLC